MKPYRFAPDRFEQEGWQGQFTRMRRWHRRALDALDGSSHDSEDFIYAFCQAAYHLRDWLLNSRAASRPELDAFMKNTPALVFCRDVCNGSKHFALDPAKTKTSHIGLMQEYVPPLSVNETGRSRPRLFVFEGQDGTVELVDIRNLMKECFEAWANFCAGVPSQSSDA